MEREKMHKLLDAVLDIVEDGEGVTGYPYASMDVSCHGTRCTVYVMDNGFVPNTKYDGVYSIDKAFDADKEYAACMEHLDRLIKEHVQKGDVTDA